MDNFVTQMQNERAALLRKAAAIDSALAAYGVKNAMVPAANHVMPAAKPTLQRETPRQPTRRSLADRVDKFGPYGQQIVDAVIAYLPSGNSAPIPTRDIVEALELAGVEVRGVNKVNALSALLARSSHIKGYGRSGWTLVKRDAPSEPDGGSNEKRDLTLEALM